MTLPANSHAAFHALLDLSFDTDRSKACVTVAHHSTCSVFTVCVFVVGSKPGDNPDWSRTLYFGAGDPLVEQMLADVLAFLEPENIARIAAEKKERRVEALHKQLEAEEAK